VFFNNETECFENCKQPMEYQNCFVSTTKIRLGYKKSLILTKSVAYQSKYKIMFIVMELNEILSDICYKTYDQYLVAGALS
jgi:hypothetical protein